MEQQQEKQNSVICPIKNDDCQIICHEAKRLQRIASAT